MRLLMTLRIAFKALVRNKLRTALTMLGMIIGVARRDRDGGARQRRAVHHREPDQVGRHEPDHRHGRQLPGGRRATGLRGGQHAHPRGRAWPSATRCRASQYLAAGVRTRRQVIAGNQNWNTHVQGTDVDLPLIRSWPVQFGAFFTSAGRQQRRQGGGAGHGGPRQPLRREHGPDRPDHPHPQPALQGGRRDGQQGPGHQAARTRTTPSSCRTRPSRRSCWGSRTSTTSRCLPQRPAT